MPFSVTLMVAEDFPVSIIDPEERSRSFVRGDIVNVRPYTGPLTPIGNQKMVFIHVTDVPDALGGYRKDDERWRRARTDDSGFPLDRARYWVRYMDAPASIRNALATDREVTVSWDQIKGYIRDKVTDTDYS